MRISQAFPTKYVSSADLQGREVTVVMSHVTYEEVGQGDHKPVVWFQGKEKGMVLNKTNANNIAAMYSDETDHWAGKQITLFTTWVDYQGRSVEAIRVRPVSQPAPNTISAAPAGPAPSMAPPSAGLPPSQQQTEDLDNQALSGGPAGLDDSIPFAPEWRG